MTGFGKSGPHITRFNSGAKVVVFNLDTVRIHTYVAPEKSFGNATHVIESNNYVIVIDTQYSVKYSKEFRKYIDSLEKPIAGVLISHGHPDHYFGLSSAFDDVPSYAFPEIIKQIEQEGDNMLINSKKEGADVPDFITVPENTLEVGEICIDNIKYKYDKYNNAEAETQLVVELPELSVVIVQDLVYNGYHPWLGKYLDNWVNIVDTIKNRYKKDYIVLPGHGNPASPAVYDEMKKYLIYAQSVIHSDSNNDNNVDIYDKLVTKYPNYRGRDLIKMYLQYLPKPMKMKMNPVGWFEIPVLDLDRAIKFYQEVLGYEFKKVLPFSSEPNTYQAWFPSLDGKPGASGSLVKGPGYAPSMDGTKIYLVSPSGDLSNELNKVETAGGKVVQEKRIITKEIGYLASFIDSEGNKVYLHSRN